MNKAEVIEKVKKILAVAENNPFPEEAQTALLKAQKFMLENGLSMLDVEFKNKKEVKEVTDKTIYESTRMSWYHKNLLVIIGDNFKCQSYTSTRRSGTKACFIGLKQDVELAKEVYMCAVNTLEFCSKNYVSRHKKPGTNATRIKNDFMLGFIKGLKDKFKEQVKVNNFALMLIKDNAVIEAIKMKKLHKVQGSPIRVNNDQSAKQAGYTQGRNFQNNTRMIADY